MSLSEVEIGLVVKYLAARLRGGKIIRIDQPDQWRLILHIQREKNRYWLLFVVHPRFSRLHLLTRRPREGKPAGGMCNVVRQHLTGSPVRELRQVEGDRVVILESVERDALLRPSPVRLIAELVGARANLILVDRDDRILAAMRTECSSWRKVAVGQPYRPLPAPPSPSPKAQANRFAHVVACSVPEDELPLSRAIQDLYQELEAKALFEERRASLLSLVRGRRRALSSRRQKLQDDLERAGGAEKLRRVGELLQIALPHLVRGQDSVTLEDVFEPGWPLVTIKLDAALTPEQNIQRCFRRYKKLKAARRHAADRLARTSQELQAVETLAQEVEAAPELAALGELEKRARASGLVVRQGRAAEKLPGGPRRFTSADGMEILVGRSERENHELTFSTARGNDYWLHLLGWQGPHVVIRKPPDKDVPLETLLDAAHLAVHYSKMRGADFAQVVYTQRKHVRPVRGAGAGRASYAHAATLAVRVEPERLRRLLDGGQVMRSKTPQNI